MATLLCVPIMVQDEPTAAADAVAARDSGADIVEFRIDEIFSGTLDSAGNLDDREVGLIMRLVEGCPLPCIVTCRSMTEGGHYDGDEMARVSLYERLGNTTSAPAYLDIEHAAYIRSANIKQKVNLAVDHPAQKRAVSSRLILSMHDFQGRPKDLLRRLAAVHDEPAARIIKVAYTARSVRDNLELFDLLEENRGGTGDGRPMIALGMGATGLMSRVLAPKFGGFLTFASLRKQSQTAPGQPTVRELLDVYRFRSVTARTRVLGVIGWPLEHTLSPLVHNAGFESLETDDWEKDERRGAERGGGGHVGDCVYVPLPVPPEYEHFKATMLALIDHSGLDFAGCSVTLPHKHNLVRLVREQQKVDDEISWTMDEMSTACWAGNTLVVKRDGRGSAVAAHVMNTDIPAATGVLTDALGDLSGKRIAIIGAGGVARSIATGVLARGARVAVHARRLEAAEEFKTALSTTDIPYARGYLEAAELSSVGDTPSDAYVNCTPVGMKGGPSPAESPVDVARIAASSPSAIVFDTIYNPLLTPLLERASLAGLRSIGGLEMFVRQAAEQFTAWTERPAPLNLFRAVCREALSGS